MRGKLRAVLGGGAGVLAFFVVARAEAAEPTAERAVATSVGAAPVDAASFRFHATGGAAKALGGYQERELSWGAALLGAVEWGPSARFGVQLEGGFLGLAGSGAAPPPGVARLDGASGGLLLVGGRLRPFAPARKTVDAAGLWLSAAGGVGMTGGGAFPALDIFVGYDFFVTNTLGVGPGVGYVHVFDTEEGPRADDGSFISFGLHATFDLASRPRVPPDRDRDGIVDESDRCPTKPEDRDGFEDTDGCPDLDDDRDGVLVPADVCPEEPEDRDEFEDENGCPDPDDDQDEIPDTKDACPREAEDRDGFEDENGCPEADNDRDEIVDARDLCPNEPETLNGFSDNDGCPDEEHVRVVGDKIELDQKIHFWSDSSVIRGISYPVLDKLAEFLKAHPEYVHVDIEGHADERGPQELNLELSAARAAAVAAFLVGRGVDASRVSSAGFGSTRPLVEGKTEHAWFMNRRVEFIVTRERVESSGVPPASAPPASTSPASTPPASTVVPTEGATP